MQPGRWEEHNTQVCFEQTTEDPKSRDCWTSDFLKQNMQLEKVTNMSELPTERTVKKQFEKVSHANRDR